MCGIIIKYNDVVSLCIKINLEIMRYHEFSLLAQIYKIAQII